jgi:hypothetical protein
MGEKGLIVARGGAMSATARLGAVLAVVVTFGVTAVLAIALTRGVPVRASLVSVSQQGRHHATAAASPAATGPAKTSPPVFTRGGTGENGSHETQRDRDHARRLASPSSD